MSPRTSRTARSTSLIALPPVMICTFASVLVPSVRPLFKAALAAPRFARRRSAFRVRPVSVGRCRAFFSSSIIIAPDALNPFARVHGSNESPGARTEVTLSQEGLLAALSWPGSLGTNPNGSSRHFPVKSGELNGSLQHIYSKHLDKGWCVCRDRGLLDFL